jgi:prepilin-type N-terminal cleavage/methylation domain-containing protein
MKKGFTFIELMIVLAIIVILALIAVPLYNKHVASSSNAAAKDILESISKAQNALNETPEELEGYVFTNASPEAAVEALARFGFQPDPNVAFAIVPSVTPEGQSSFIALAAHINPGSPVYIYDGSAEPAVCLYDMVYAPAATVTLPAELITFTFNAAAEAGSMAATGETKAVIPPTGSGLEGAAKIQ